MKREGVYHHERDILAKIRLDPGASDAELKSTLERWTPVGCSLGPIFNVIQGHLCFEGGPASGIALIGKAGIGVILGHYHDEQTDAEVSVRVVWVYDTSPQPRLKDIKVKRVNFSAPLAR